MTYRPGDKIIITESNQIVLRKVSETHDGFVVDEFNQKIEVEKVRFYKPYFDDIHLAKQTIRNARLALLPDIYAGKIEFKIGDSQLPTKIVGQTEQYLWYMVNGRDHLPPETYGKSTFRDRVLSGFIKPIEPKE